MFSAYGHSLLGESEMDSVNLWGFYAIGGSIRRIVSITSDMTLAEAHLILAEAEAALNFLLYDKCMVPLTECRGAGNDLWVQITENIKRAQESPSEQVGNPVHLLHKQLEAFDIILRNTCGFVPAYHVSPKGILSTQKLVNSAEEMFSSEVLSHLSKVATEDIKSAGRCLAFNLPTSVGFHIIRALEAVVVDYIVKKTGTRPKRRELAEYVDILKKQEASEDVVFVIDQIRRLHRNPLMHPEDILTPDEAMDLFLLCRSAINSTISDMDKNGLFQIQEKSITP